MKKIVYLLAAAILFTACSKENQERKILKKENKIINTEVKPLFNDFTKELNKIAKKISEDIESKKENIDINQAIKDIESAEAKTIKYIEEKKKSFKNQYSLAYMDLKIKYVNLMSKVHTDILVKLQEQAQKNRNNFDKSIKEVFNHNQDKIDMLEQEDMKLSEELEKHIK